MCLFGIFSFFRRQCWWMDRQPLRTLCRLGPLCTGSSGSLMSQTLQRWWSAATRPWWSRRGHTRTSEEGHSCLWSWWGESLITDYVNNSPVSLRTRYLPKANITFNDNHTVVYDMPVGAIFEPSMSVGSEDDEFTTINLVVAVSQTCENVQNLNTWTSC